MISGMTNWTELMVVAPELAATVESRLTAQLHCLLATLRRDGSPRISGLEPEWWDGDLVITSMPASRKTADLRRDGRFAMHSAPDTDPRLAHGDVKLSGRAREITPGAADLARYLADRPPPPGGVAIFRTALEAVSVARVVDDWMEITSWRAGEPVQVRNVR